MLPWLVSIDKSFRRAFDGLGVFVVKKFLQPLVLVMALLSMAQPASACSCAEPDDVKTTFGKAGVVVAAEAIAVLKEEGVLTTTDNKPYESTFEIVEWNVDESWKGPYHRNQRFKARTAVTCCICGRSVEIGEVLLLYLSGPEPYDIHICGRNAPLKHALKDIPILYQISGSPTATSDGN